MPSRLIGHVEDMQEGNNQSGVRTYTHVWKVLTDRDNTAYVAGSAVGLPQVGSFHWEDPDAVCQGLNVKPIDNKGPTKDSITGGKLGLYWLVKADYTTEKGFGIPTNTNPLAEQARISWVGEGYEELVNTDGEGNIIVNTAFTPVRPFSKDRTRPIAKIRKNVSDIPIAAIDTWPDSINKSGFSFRGLSVAEKKARYKFGGLSEAQVRNGVTFKEFTFEFHFRKDWKRYIPNVGRYERLPSILEPGGFAIYPIRDGNGVSVSKEVPLTSAGSAMSQTTITNSDDILKIEVEPEIPLDFSVLSPFFS